MNPRFSRRWVSATAIGCCRRSSTARRLGAHWAPTRPLRPDCRRACPWCWAISTSSARVSAADLYEPAGGRRRFHLRLHGHAHALRGVAGRRSAQRVALRLHDVLADPGACASMQSNMAATLNIDWLLDVAREAASIAGAETSSSGASARHGRARARRRAGIGDLPSLYL